jgi:RNA polymerase sigma factor (TIGR02999 family)
MNDVTRILSRIESGDPTAAEQLLPLVYDELRKLAAQKLAQEQPGRTLQATALVHEGYIRLVDTEKAQHWNSRGHFFAAAAEAMRRILVEDARRRRSQKRGGHYARQELDESNQSVIESSVDLLELDEALTRLAETDQQAAQLVQLRYFAGLSMEQAAELLGVSRRQAHYIWSYARTWLHRELRDD